MIVKSSHQLWTAYYMTSLSERINSCFAKLLMSIQMNFLPDSEFNAFSIPSILWTFPPAGSPAGKVHHHIVRSFSFFKTQVECHFLLEAFPGSFLSPRLTMPPVVVQSLSRVWLFETPWTAAHQASLSFTTSWSLLKHMSTESVMPSNHLILGHPLLLLPSVFSRIRVFSNESFPGAAVKLLHSPLAAHLRILYYLLFWLLFNISPLVL